MAKEKKEKKEKKEVSCISVLPLCKKIPITNPS